MDNVGFFAGIKRPGRGADHSLLFRAEFKNEWRWTSSLSVGFHGMTIGYLLSILCQSLVCLSASNVLHTRTQTNINEHVLHSEKKRLFVTLFK
jgi:hypothetical protein